jgi:hypothetical protein
MRAPGACCANVASTLQLSCLLGYQPQVSARRAHAESGERGRVGGGGGALIARGACPTCLETWETGSHTLLVYATSACSKAT